MKQIKLALDWTPNINHIGFLVSHELGFYKEKGVDIKIISPDSDDYKYTPAKKIESTPAARAVIKRFTIFPGSCILSRTRTKSSLISGW